MIRSLPRIAWTARHCSQRRDVLWSGRAWLSTSTTADADGTGAVPPNQQEFVRERFAPGEFDRERTNPLDRPPIKHRARVISAEDFANRPKVSFNEEFDSLHDAGVVLSWLCQADRDDMYQTYLDTMERMVNSEKNRVTSHEYVMQAIAQKFNVGADTVGAVVELAHAEDQQRRLHPEREIHHDVQDYVDRKIAEHIKNAYSEYDEPTPQAPYVEDHAEYDLHPLSHQVETVDDTVDVERKLLELERKDAELMQKMIDDKVYTEDRDDNLRNVKLHADAKQLLEHKHRFDIERATLFKTNLQQDDEEPRQYERPRWQYVAKIIDTREEKRKHKLVGKKRRKITQKQARAMIENTLVEHDGKLRAATVAEASSTEWQPPTDRTEFLYKQVKAAWLEKKLRGEVGGWGRVEARPVVVEEEEKKTMTAEGGEGGDDNGTGEVKVE